MVIFEEAAAPDIAKDIVRFYFEVGVVAPGFRIADTHIESGELGLCFGLGCGSHPGKSIDALAKCSDDVCNHRLRFSLCLRREIPLRVKLADFVTKQSVDDKDAALPARTLLRRTGKCLSKKGEALVGKGLWQNTRIGFDEVI